MAKRKSKTDKVDVKIRKFKEPQTPNQAVYLEALHKNEVILCTGPAGCGKTALAVSYATQQFLSAKYDRIIITRPVVEAGESLGFLPGDATAKLKPYLIPIYDEFKDFLNLEEMKQLMFIEKIEICPLAHMRGRNFHNTIVIADEMQNALQKQLMNLITRIGKNCKLIINGDTKQSDLPHRHQGGLDFFTERLCRIPKIGVVRMGSEDIVRNPLITEILAALEEDGV